MIERRMPELQISSELASTGANSDEHYMEGPRIARPREWLSAIISLCSNNDFRAILLSGIGTYDSVSILMDSDKYPFSESKKSRKPDP